MSIYCCDEHRVTLVAQSPTINGIEFLEVKDRNHQETLFVHLLKAPAGPIGPENIRLTGGERVTGIRADSVTANGKVLTVVVSQAGDMSTYTLTIVGPDGNRFPWMDPILSSVSFSFKVDCPNDFDCDRPAPCPPDATPAPEIDYLAKDWTSFRQLMLDRLSVLQPGWTERHAADLGVALVELLAYVGDHLSYEQDAVATEAYLETARQRASIRRHARLVDYHMHDGCNARVFVHFEVTGTVTIDTPDDAHDPVRLFTTVAGLPGRIDPSSPDMPRLLAAAPEAFENLHGGTFYPAHNTIGFHTWGDERCCLATGATRATLKGHLPDLKPCDVLVFEEVKGPDTGEAADADPRHRWALRLIEVKCTDGGQPLLDPVVLVDPKHPAKGFQPITEITWHEDDALPFPLCLSSISDADHGSRPVEGISVAHGNIVLCDHGATVREDPDVTGQNVPDANPALAIPASLASAAGDCCGDRTPVEVPPRYRPRLQQAPLTQVPPPSYVVEIDGRLRRMSFDPHGSASSAFAWDIRAVLPAARLLDHFDGRWLPQRDLIGSDESAREFVAEIDDRGRATLRFGDDVNGVRPVPPLTFKEFRYRIGNGVAGNVGADSITHVASTDSGITGVRNILPARGGVDPEAKERVRRDAPFAFRVQERAVTPADYAEVTERHAQVQRAATTVRWTGSWYTNFITVDRLGGRPVDAAFEQTITDHVEKYRMAGHDVEVNAPRFVSLEIAMDVCLLPGYFRSHVTEALLDVLSSGTRKDGQRGFFHPDNFTFGQPVYLSRLIAAAQSVTGVHHVDVTTFQRQGVPDAKPLRDEVLPLGRLEIARLDNNPNFPEHGVLTITPLGGQ